MSDSREKGRELLSEMGRNGLDKNGLRIVICSDNVSGHGNFRLSFFFLRVFLPLPILSSSCGHLVFFLKGYGYYLLQTQLVGLGFRCLNEITCPLCLEKE